MSKAKPEEVVLGIVALIGAGVLFFWPGLTAKLIGLSVLTVAGGSGLSLGSRGGHRQIAGLSGVATCIAGMLVVGYADKWWEYLVGGFLILSAGYVAKS